MSKQQDQTVARYMSESFETVGADSSLVAAAERMGEANMGAVIVTGEPTSIVTSTDIVRQVAEGADTSQLHVDDAATEVTTTINPTQHIKDAASTMLQEKISYVPVTDEGDIVGVLSKTDITESNTA
ncbi:CBS domain-containing protein [Halovenus sp. HT40]|uniref:CBS domain-containing protein n=1 Tax=Halovenus sp. HT40 TaxID=3126691 RepID=UPI00300EFC1F